MWTHFVRGPVNVLGNRLARDYVRIWNSSTHPSRPSQVPRIVQLKPRIDRMPKFRWLNRRVNILAGYILFCLESCIAYLQHWLLSHALEMRIITLHLSTAPAGDRSTALHFIGHHGFFFWMNGMDTGGRCKYEGSDSVKSTKMCRKKSIGQYRNAGGMVYNLIRCMYVTSTRLEGTWVDDANAICLFQFNLRHALPDGRSKEASRPTISAMRQCPQCRSHAGRILREAHHTQLHHSTVILCGAYIGDGYS